jgi:hypothetical protein
VIMRYHSVVRGDAPSAAFAARNSSTARPSVRCLANQMLTDQGAPNQVPKDQ